ncbi:MAG: hypothetical protein AB8H86_22965 [Polyangiales bacterium]
MALLYRCRRLSRLVAEAARKDPELVERLTWDFAGLTATAVLGEALRKSIDTLHPVVELGDIWALRRAAEVAEPRLEGLRLLLALEGPEVGPDGDTGRSRLHDASSLIAAVEDAQLPAGDIAVHTHIAHRGALKRAKADLDAPLSLIETRVLSAVLEGHTRPAIATEIGFSEDMVRATQRSLGDKLGESVLSFEELDDDGGLKQLQGLALAAAEAGDFLLAWYSLSDT